MLYGREIFIGESTIELDDDTIGLFDDPIEMDLMEW